MGVVSLAALWRPFLGLPSGKEPKRLWKLVSASPLLLLRAAFHLHLELHLQHSHQTWLRMSQRNQVGLARRARRRLGVHAILAWLASSFELGLKESDC